MQRIEFTIPGKPAKKDRPRFARIGRGVRTYSSKDTQNQTATIKFFAYQNAPRMLIKGPVKFTVRAYFAPPKSMALWKRSHIVSGEIRPTVKPDFDNIAKIIADAINGIVWKDDSQVVSHHFEKLYSDNPRTEVIIEELPVPVREKRKNERELV